ncbi:MAG: DUF4332 domain-containing protein [Flavobacteriales bacterium]|nr:DUF4332 domain-containing protein [Flavobacteriales bacterium]
MADGIVSYQKKRGDRSVVNVMPANGDAAVLVKAKKAAPKAEVLSSTGEVKAAKGDDLRKVEGIGPKIAELFNAAGINTFAELAATSADRLKEILTEGGSAFASHDPGTWPKQAELAAAGKWDELKAWQDELNGGK